MRAGRDDPGAGAASIRESRRSDGGLVLGIVLALLLIGGSLAALLYTAGLAEDEAPQGFNLVGSALAGPGAARPSRS
jgi:hypothetical protein